jgi:hypothetical protein
MITRQEQNLFDCVFSCGHDIRELTVEKPEPLDENRSKWPQIRLSEVNVIRPNRHLTRSLIGKMQRNNTNV